MPGEVVVEVIRRHWITFVMRAWPAFATAAVFVLLGGLLGVAGGVVGGAAVGAAPLALVALGLLIGGGWALGVWLDYADDLLILTTHRVINLERTLYVIAQSTAEARYSTIQDIQVDIPPMGQILHFGTLDIETAGRARDIQLNFMPRPRELQDRIFARIAAAEARAEHAQRRNRRMEFSLWMGTLLNGMVPQVPDVRGLPALEAAGRVRASRLRLIVREERYEPRMPPGVVLAQTPSAGSTAVVASDVAVVLSGEP